MRRSLQMITSGLAAALLCASSASAAVRANSASSPRLRTSPTLACNTSLQGLILQGAAQRFHHRIRLVATDQLLSAGAAWTPDPCSVSDGFRASFRFAMSQPQTTSEFPAGADGIAFVVQSE